jgi:hypothetical protein
MNKPTIAQVIQRSEKKKHVVRKRNKSVYTGPLRQKISPKRHYLPSAWGMTIPDRRNPLSPKHVKTKYPAFGLPRGTTTAGTMGIGLDDYIFNNAKRNDPSSITKSPRKTKATESMASRPEERNSSFLWSRGSSTRVKGSE